MQEKLIKDDMALSGVITRGCGGMQSIEAVSYTHLDAMSMYQFDHMVVKNLVQEQKLKI